jgi:hypothetical protein
MKQHREITAGEFERATGATPQNDDLDRCNCALAGRPGHWGCGWDEQANLPMFMTMRRLLES